MNVSRFVLSCLCALGLLLSGCGDAAEQPQYGAWTVAKDSLRLTENLRVSETQNFYFGSITALDVTSDGHMVVADMEANHIKVLASDGTLIDTLGGSGEGPGQFQRLGRLQVACGDSLFAYDSQQTRLTVYGPDSPYRLSRTVAISRETARIGRLHVLNEALVGVEFNVIRQPEEGVQHPDPMHWRLLSETGTPGDTLFRTRAKPYAIHKMNRGLSLESVPFARQTHIAVGSDARVYTGWPDSLQIRAVAPTGRSETVVSIPTASPPVQPADRDSALHDMGTELRNMIEPAIPDTKPAFTDLIVADDGRLWVQRPAQKTQSETVPWWILDPDRKTIHQARLPRDVELDVVRDGRAYGTTTTDAGAPALVRYHIDMNA